MLKYSVDQLMKFNNFTVPTGISLIKQLGLLLVFSWTGCTIPSFWTAVRSVASQPRHQSTVAPRTISVGVPIATPIRTHDRNRGVDFNLLRPIRSFSASPNMCLTETWQQPDVFSVLNEACPSGYTYIQKSRSTGRGGGLAIIHHKDLDLFPLPLLELHSFECLAFKCNPPPLHLTILLIYHPPNPN